MNDLLTLFNLLITLALLSGSVVAYRHGFARAEDEILERVIKALQSEIQALKDRLESLEKENIRLNHVIMTIRTVLKIRGLHITIDGELVSIQDQTGTTTHATHMDTSSHNEEDY